MGREEQGRAGGQSAELGSQRGAPAAPAASHCLQTARSLAEGSTEQSEAGASAAGSRRPVWSVRLRGRARAGRKWDSRHRSAQPGAPGGRGADGRSRPPLRPFPFAFIRGDKSAVRQPAFQFTDNDSCMKIDRGALHRRALSPPALLLLPAAPPRVPPPPLPPPHPLRLSQWWDVGRGDNQKGGVLVARGEGSLPSPASLAQDLFVAAASPID